MNQNLLFDYLMSLKTVRKTVSVCLMKAISREHSCLAIRQDVAGFCCVSIGRILLKSACDGNLLVSMQLGDEGRVDRVLIGKYFLKYIRRTVFKS